MRIIKRDGREEDFDIRKVKRAIQGANDDLNRKGLHKETLRAEGVEYVAAVIYSWAEDLGHTPHVEEVQNEVHNLLAEVGRYELARQYEAYRTEHAIDRDTAVLFTRVEAIVDCVSEEARQENSNKNVDVVSVQRDYIAGEVSRAYTEQKLLPDDILTAHREGVIHFHDADYFMTREHNCFVGSTTFVTSKGPKTFDELGPGCQVKVLDLKGRWRNALADYYGYQETQDVTLASDDTTRTVRCTQDHAWILENGTRTETLKVGDVLMPLHESGCQKLGIEQRTWVVTAIEPTGKKEHVWCVEEPVTHTFTLADGIVTGNCGVYNLDDMLQNGTVISGTMIEKPHSFSTACNIATQVIAQIASTSYGGQTFSLAHLAPFVDVSRKRFAAKLRERLDATGESISEDAFDTIVEGQVRDEVKKGIQTIQYQLITLMTTNGQAPFVSVFMWLDEVPDGQTREDLAMMIEETIRQRYEGVKDKTGNWITPAFPKLLYVLDEDNTYEGSKYFYLTKLAAQCTARRLVPDYISAKKMRELKLSKGETTGNGDVYGCMGCVDGDEVVAWRIDGALRVESIRRMYDEVSRHFGAKAQEPGSPHTLVELDGVEIFDDVDGWTPCRRIIRNKDQRVLSLRFVNGRTLTCTPDHPFTTENRGDVRADELDDEDVIRIDKTSDCDEGTEPHDVELAWLEGLVLLDGCYDQSFSVSVAMSGEDDIAERFSEIMSRKFDLTTHTVERHRGLNGPRKNVYACSDNTDCLVPPRLVSLMESFATEFGGKEKHDRLMRQRYEKVAQHIRKWDKGHKRDNLRGLFCDKQEDWRQKIAD